MIRFRTNSTVILAVVASIGVLFGFNAVLAQDVPGEAAATFKSSEPPLSDTRLPVHTLLREDIFAGFLEHDMKRFARGEKNIDKLIELRPAQKANLLAWKGGAMLFRAALASESHNDEEFKRNYEQATDLLAQAAKIDTGNDGVNAITGGSYALFADRLPKENRPAAWKRAYDSYRALWKQQGGGIQLLPVHFRGEVLGGLALSAQRTGQTQEADQYLDKMMTMLHDTPYEAAAKKWKEDPKSASTEGITCLSCHDGGRLAARVSALDKIDKK